MAFIDNCLKYPIRYCSDDGLVGLLIQHLYPYNDYVGNEPSINKIISGMVYEYYKNIVKGHRIL